MKEPVFNSELRKLVRDYFEWHGEDYTGFLRRVVDSNGSIGAICRIRGEHGKITSVLVHFPTDSHGDIYVSEMTSVPKDNEENLIDWFIQGGNFETYEES